MPRSEAFAWFLALAVGGLACATPGGAGSPTPSRADRPLTVNAAGGGDLYVSQNGAFVSVAVEEGVTVFHLRSAPFQIGTSSHQVNLCLTEIAAPEIRVDPKGFKASCLSGPFQSAQEPDTDELFVHSGTSWTDGNCVLQAGSHRTAAPLAGYATAYQVNELVFIDRPGTKLATFRGTIHGHLVVYREHVRRPQDIMAIRLVFDVP